MHHSETTGGHAETAGGCGHAETAGGCGHAGTAGGWAGEKACAFLKERLYLL
ncbi:MAG: hypothetical protein LBD24_06855 [Spirochaetaceae bacterium]|nr:hypothetical protein [Spirochaetaceae bacterium]